jgi:hypothetical protein
MKPVSGHLRSEPAIVAGIAAATLGDTPVRLGPLVADYDRIRDLIEAVDRRLRRLQPARARTGRLRAAEPCPRGQVRCRPGTDVPADRIRYPRRTSPTASW